FPPALVTESGDSRDVDREVITEFPPQEDLLRVRRRLSAGGLLDRRDQPSVPLPLPGGKRFRQGCCPDRRLDRRREPQGKFVTVLGRFTYLRFRLLVVRNGFGRLVVLNG